MAIVQTIFLIIKNRTPLVLKKNTYKTTDIIPNLWILKKRQTRTNIKKKQHLFKKCNDVKLYKFVKVNKLQIK